MLLLFLIFSDICLVAPLTYPFDLQCSTQVNRQQGSLSCWAARWTNCTR